MSAIFFQSSIESSSTVHFINETHSDYSNSIDSINFDSSIHLFALIAIWIVLLVTIIFGTIGNTLVLYVYINRKDNKSCTFFIKVLAVVDLIICLILAPLELYQVTTGMLFEERKIYFYY